MTAIKRLIIKIAISLACLSILPLFVTMERLTDLILKTSLFPVLAALALIFSSILLSSIRFHGMMASFQASAPLASAHRINILSQIVGLFAFQTLGQMIFRSTYGGYFVKNPQRLAALTLLEKAVALSTLLMISMSGSFYITRNIEIGGREGLAILITLSAILLSVVCVYGFSLTSGQRRFGRKVGAFLRRAGLERAAFISFMMHVMMLLSYIMIAHAYIPDTSWVMTAAIFSVVMLGAALPISFAGWGVRELSAGFIFSFLGLDPSIGVLVSAVIGILSLLALAGHGVIINFITSRRGQVLPSPVGQIEKIHIERALALFSGIAIAVLVEFQVRIPTGSGALTVNLADPVAFLAAISFLTIWYRAYFHHAVWRINGFALTMFLFSIMIAYGWAHGYVRYGVIDWASFNRGVGFLILLAYLFSGSMVTAFFGRRAIRSIIRAILFSMLCILVLYVSTINFLDHDTMSRLRWKSYLFNGLIGNRNALAFGLTLVLSISLAIKEPILGRWRLTAISLISFLILVSGSRTGIVTAALVVLIATYFKYFSVKELVQTLTAITAIALAYFLLTLLVVYVSQPGANLLTGANALNSLDVQLLSRIDADRVASYSLGFEMWLANPVFGAGMGGFILKNMDNFRAPLTIHNSGLWMLAEMGLVGFMLFLSLPLAILVHIRKKYCRRFQWDDFALLLCLISTVVFSQAHDILYQRILWFLLGLLAANKICMRDTLSRRKAAEH